MTRIVFIFCILSQMKYFKYKISFLHVCASHHDKTKMYDNHCRAANCYDFGVAATPFNPDYAATLVTSMLRLQREPCLKK